MAFAVTWIGVWVGLMVRDPDGADGIVMSVIFPLMFLSGIFVPVAGLPDGAAPDREVQPVTALPPRRELFGSPTGDLPDVWVAPAPGARVAGLGGGVDGGVRAAGDPALQAAGLLSAGEVEPQLGCLAEVDVLGVARST